MSKDQLNEKLPKDIEAKKPKSQKELKAARRAKKLAKGAKKITF
jgi:hypothetical protein